MFNQSNTVNNYNLSASKEFSMSFNENFHAATSHNSPFNNTFYPGISDHKGQQPSALLINKRGIDYT